LNDGERLSYLLKLNPEDLPFKWFNYHLPKAGCDKKITNFSDICKLYEKYTIILNELNKQLNSSYKEK
jgi:hypothetical protein